MSSNLTKPCLLTLENMFSKFFSMAEKTNNEGLII